MLLYYAIGDIHGEIELLSQMMDEIYRREPGTIVFIGDYIDRGPTSKEVLDLVMSGPEKPGFIFVPLKGNHEDMCVKAYKSKNHFTVSWQNWIDNGGYTMLQSFAKEGDVPEKYREWMKNLLVYHDNSMEYIFVHAGLEPGKQPSECSANCMLWLREDDAEYKFMNFNYDWGKIVIHGHTIVHDPEVRHNRINIDTGGHHYGKLTCAVLSGGRGVEFIQVDRSNEIFVWKDTLPSRLGSGKQ